MNENEVEAEYMENGYNYPAGAGSESFMGFFGGGGVPAPAPYQYSNMSTMHHQESEYWLMHMNAYKYGVSAGEESTSYYGVYADENGQRLDFTSRGWDHPPVTTTTTTNVQEEDHHDHHTPQLDTISVDNRAGSPDQEDVVLNAQVLLMDDDGIDPDTMTYEELLDLGEAVGTQSRGLSQELINQLPTSKHKSGGIFSRRKSQDRCVICQMRYKRGDRQINLPCNHAYHTDCGSKWLSINKTCPVCNTEVFGNESSH